MPSSKHPTVAMAMIFGYPGHVTKVYG